MAVNQLINTDTLPNTRILRNGAVQDVATGRIVAMPELTRAKALDMVRSRVERKRAIVAAAAQDAVSRGDLRGKYGDEAWIAEVTQAQMQIATTPDAGKSAVMAAGWLMDHAGMGERQQQDTAQPTMSDVSRIVDALTSFVQQVTSGSVIPIRQDNGVIDAE